ncbi:MAG: TRAP transporter small permease subunit [Mameliella sp.]|nr:TRAP transporter small permease subunit [Phaeodactylibacter sp.]NRA51962.1 TRAP transporter small permease subunit [Phaeodactylibacter sp.]
MQSTLRKIALVIHRINEQIGRAAAWLTTLLMVLVCFDVVVRYLFNDTQAWIMELEWHMFGLIFLLGAGYAFRHDRHVRVDLFYTKFSAKDKALVNLIGGILFLVPWTAVLVYVSFEYANIAFKIREGSPDPGGLPARYAIKYAITIGMLLLLLQGIASIIDNWLIYRGEQPSTSANSEKH